MSLKTIPVIVALTDPHGSPVEGARIVAQLVTSADGIPAFDVDVATGVVVPSRVVATTAETGVATLNLWPNELGSYATAYIIEASCGARTLLQTTISVPDMDPVAATHIENLIQVPPFPSVDASQQALAAVQAATAFVVANADASAASALAAQGSATDAVDAQAGAEIAAVAATTRSQEAELSSLGAQQAADSATISAAQAGASASAASVSAGAAATARDGAELAESNAQASASSAASNASAALAIYGSTVEMEAAVAAAVAAASQASDDAATAQAASAQATIDASTAITQAGIATAKASEASISATTAQAQAGIASAQASDAAGSADTASTQAGIATNQAGIATSAAGTATNQAGIATSAAGTATTKAGEASASASAAHDSEVAAAASQSAADASAVAAGAAETVATAQAAIATTKAGEASTSASSAATSASNASASANSAAVQAGIATTKADEASASASAASASASNASASAIAAAASLDSFDDRYLGAKAAAPTVDNDGQALLTGALYWDTSQGALRVWTGTAWTNTTELDDRVLADQQLMGAIAYVTDIALKVVDGVAENTGTYRSTDRAELFTLMFGEVLEKIGVIGRAVSGGTIELQAGTAAIPSLMADTDTDTGLFWAAANALAIATGGVERARVTADGRVGIGTNAPSGLLDIADNKIRVRTAQTPSSATAAGNAGEICWDASYVYVCTNTNTWRRAALSTW